MKSKSAVKPRKAYAKINLTFEVLGRREDGYHEIASVMQAIDLADVLTFEPHEHIFITCNVPELVSPNNLVFRAAGLMQAIAGPDHGVAIRLEKSIPLAGGLGGGSSDAAATLQGLNEIWGLKLAPEKLQGIAAGLGSDVSFFVSGCTTALVRGRGDRVVTLPSLPRTWVVLVRPPVNVSGKTQKMYARLDPSRFTRGQHTRRMAKLIEEGERAVTPVCYNIFDYVAPSFFPGLDGYWQRFLAVGAGEVHVAGAGPVLFTLVNDRAEGEEICKRLKKERVEAYLAGTL